MYNKVLINIDKWQGLPNVKEDIAKYINENNNIFKKFFNIELTNDSAAPNIVFIINELYADMLSENNRKIIYDNVVKNFIENSFEKESILTNKIQGKSELSLCPNFKDNSKFYISIYYGELDKMTIHIEIRDNKLAYKIIDNKFADFLYLELEIDSETKDLENIKTELSYEKNNKTLTELQELNLSDIDKFNILAYYANKYASVEDLEVITAEERSDAFFSVFNKTYIEYQKDLKKYKMLDIVHYN